MHLQKRALSDLALNLPGSKMIFAQPESQLERKWRNSGKLEVHRLDYQNQRFLVKDMIKKAKIDYYSSQVNESAGDQKKLFKQG